MPESASTSATEPDAVTPSVEDPAPEVSPAVPLPPPMAILPDLTNPLVPAAETRSNAPITGAVPKPMPADIVRMFAATNGLPPAKMSEKELTAHRMKRLELARHLRMIRQASEAEPILTELLDDTSPEPLQQSALLELAAAVQDEDDLPRAQQIYAQFLSKWPEDTRVPEILLRQGMLFRRMGLYNLAFGKFYSVMTSALILKNDQFDYYARLVLQAQTEIAETQYELGRYPEAADFFARLLKQSSPSINKSQILYKLTRCHAAIGQYTNAIADAEDYLKRFPGAPEQPEIRFYLALALKQVGRDNDSLQQVLTLLQEQRALTKQRPEVWAYWQQRAGNLIANQLYHEGDYTQALQIYSNLARLDSSPEWQLPVYYQIGVTYERLDQPEKAAQTYNRILSQEKNLGTNVPPSLKTVLDMARWRANFIKWQGKAEADNHQLELTGPPAPNERASLSTAPETIP